jgi:hypothetical protein
MLEGVIGATTSALSGGAATARTDGAVAEPSSAPVQNANPRVPRLAVSFQVQTYFADISTQTGGKACAKAQ